MACALIAAVALIAAGTGLNTPAVSLLGACPPPARAVTTAAVGPAGLPFGPGQIANAQTIYQVGAELGLPAQAEIVALATAMQESGLQNLAYGTGTSLGLFQQEPGLSWGTAAQIMDPVYASRSFYLRLAQVPGWQTMPVTVAAQAVASRTSHTMSPGRSATSQPTTAAPSPVRRSATARPMPLAAPDTSATLPSSRPMPRT
jgi:hypothetical protein